MYIVVAQNWEAFNWFCEQRELNAWDRKVTIPLITYSDKYRLYGRDLRTRQHQVVKVGKIEETLAKQLERELLKEGVKCKLL